MHVYKFLSVVCANFVCPSLFMLLGLCVCFVCTLALFKLPCAFADWTSLCLCTCAHTLLLCTKLHLHVYSTFVHLYMFYNAPPCSLSVACCCTCCTSFCMLHLYFFMLLVLPIARACFSALAWLVNFKEVIIVNILFGL